MYEIPKIVVPIVLHLSNDESIPGSVWLTENLISNEGNPLLEEFLNQKDDNYFSFQSDAGAFRLINKEHIIFIETEQNDTEIKKTTPFAPSTMVAHFANAQTLYGVIYPTIAEETRVSDFLNQPLDFLVLYRQQQKIVFNRSLVVYANAN
ncbi:MAG: hypothetical protein ACI9FB_001321 [Candidatus Azotimanducaceae bacterium]|jgi:hypothetical protein